MFGYVKVHKPELKVREYELYRSAYCGLCHSMGKCTGQCSRMTLSYDFAFLVLVRTGLSGEKPEFSRKRCIAHPFTKGIYMKNNPTLQYCSGAAAILNYHKIADDLSDEKGFKRLKSAAVYPFVAHSRRKALKMGLKPLDEKISEELRRLSDLEKERKKSVDLPAKIFGDILGEIMSYGIEGTEGRIGRAFGQAVGKWIYTADALEDWKDDAQKGRYNPFYLLYEKNAPTEDELEGIKSALKNQLIEAEGAFDLCDFESNDLKNVIMNVLYLGMPNRIEEIDFKDKKDKDKKGKAKK